MRDEREGGREREREREKGEEGWLTFILRG